MPEERRFLREIRTICRYVKEHGLMKRENITGMLGLTKEQAEKHMNFIAEISDFIYRKDDMLYVDVIKPVFEIMNDQDGNILRVIPNNQE